MNILNRLFTWYGKKTVLIVGAFIIALGVAGVIFQVLSSSEDDVEAQEDSLPAVSVRKVSNLSTESSFAVTGTVRAVSEARLQAESGGRITSVNVELGDTVYAGQIIATFENSSQRAALLQAEGSYEAALASAASSEVSVESAEEAIDSAQSSALSAYRSAYITAEGILRNDIDDLFTITNDQAIGIKIDAKGQANVLNDERNALDAEIAQWQSQKDSVTANTIERELSDTKALVRRMASFVETLSALLSDSEVTSSFTEADKSAMITAIYSARASLNALSSNLDQSETAITNAKNALEQAQLTGSSDTSSASSAQIKIALGSYRSAQANYEKTLVRTPISGVVNALYLTVGEYASPSQEAVIIANNNALEITGYVNQTESERLLVGQTVMIKDTIEGRLTQIAPAIDPTTGKIEIKVQTESSEVQNGDTVSLSFPQSNEAPSTPASSDAQIIIPITALKVETDRIVVFTVSSDNTLIAHPITEGPLMGSNIIIEEGVTADMEIVLDARGLNEGDKVEVI